VIGNGEILKKMIKIQLIINPPLKVTGFAFVYSERSDQPIIEVSMSLKAVKKWRNEFGIKSSIGGQVSHTTG